MTFEDIQQVMRAVCYALNDDYCTLKVFEDGSGSVLDGADAYLFSFNLQRGLTGFYEDAADWFCELLKVLSRDVHEAYYGVQS